MSKTYYDDKGREVLGFYRVNGKTMKIVEKLPTIYHGGRSDDYDTMAEGHSAPGIIFCTDNKEQASGYSQYRGDYLHSFSIKKDAKIMNYDLEGDWYKNAYKYIEDESNWSLEELAILTKYKNDPLAGIAYVYQERGYDILRIKNVIDHPGKGTTKLPLTNDYIILNKNAVIPAGKDKINHKS